MDQPCCPIADAVLMARAVAWPFVALLLGLLMGLPLTCAIKRWIAEADDLSIEGMGVKASASRKQRQERQGSPGATPT